MDEQTNGFRDRVARQGEEKLGRVAEELFNQPLVRNTLARAFEARERALQAQEAAMGALNLPSASDLERLTRRVRGVSQRLESIEDSLDGLANRLEGANGQGGALTNDRLARIETQLANLTRELKTNKGPNTRARSQPTTRKTTRS